MVTPESSYTVRENLQEKDSASLASPPEGGSRSLSLEGEKQVAQQGSGEGVDDDALLGENVASGAVTPVNTSLPLSPLDTEDPSTSSLAEPLSSTLTDDRPTPGGAVHDIDHAQRSLGPIYMVTGGLEKMAEDFGMDTDELRPLKAAKKSAVATLGMGKFIKRDLVLNHLLADVPDDDRDGLRVLEYIKWADELVEEQHAAIGGATPAASGGAA